VEENEVVRDAVLSDADVFLVVVKLCLGTELGDDGKNLVDDVQHLSWNPVFPVRAVRGLGGGFVTGHRTERHLVEHRCEHQGQVSRDLRRAHLNRDHRDRGVKQ
jgi:hypothetical protein